jgi:hypothetical protein
MAEYEKKIDWILPVGLVGASFLFFQFFYPYHLFFKEQIQLFLFSSDYFLAYFSKPAWLAAYTGDFLTQLFYLRGGGAIVLSLIFLLEWLVGSIVIKRIFSSTKASVWALLPVIADWILHLEILHSVSVSIGFVAVLLLFLIYTFISNRWLSIVSVPIVIFTGYWLAGMAILILPVLIVARDFNQGRFSLLKWIVAIVLVVTIPLAFRHHYLLTTLQAYIYPAIQVESLFLPAAFVFMLTGVFLLKRFELNRPKLISIVVPLVFIGLLIGGLSVNANFRFEKILSLDSETYFGNSDRVIELSQKYKLKDRQATYFTNMALAKNGVLPEHLLEFYQPSVHGLILPVMPDESWQSIFVSNEVFFLMGDMNLAQHSAMLGNTFSPYQRSSRMIKRLAEINLINGDTAAADKYLRILGKTLFHRNWAESSHLMNHSSVPTKWLSEKREQIPHTDTLRKSNDQLASLRFLVQQNPGNTIALDYLLCHYLLDKDLKSFKKAYDQYARQIDRPVPLVYSETLLIQLFASKASGEEAATYSINPQKITDFIAYTKLYEQTKGDMNALRERFGQSYWFYYHFATIQKQ